MGGLIGGNKEEGGFGLQLPGQNKWRFVTDVFRDPKRTFAVYESRNLEMWAAIPDEKLDYPRGARHGSLVFITESELKKLKKLARKAKKSQRSIRKKLGV